MRRMMATLLMLLVAPAWGATWYVDPSAEAGGDGSLGDPFATIGAALDASEAAGDHTINVLPGVCIEGDDTVWALIFPTALSGKAIVIQKHGEGSVKIRGYEEDVYMEADGVTHLARMFVCQFQHTSSSTFPPGVDSGVPGLNGLWQGGWVAAQGSPTAWADNTPYVNQVMVLTAAEPSTYASYVSHDGLDYLARADHTSSEDSEPGAGFNWRDYWIRIPSTVAAWSGASVQYDNDRTSFFASHVMELRSLSDFDLTLRGVEVDGDVGLAVRSTRDSIVLDGCENVTVRLEAGTTVASKRTGGIEADNAFYVHDDCDNINFVFRDSTTRAFNQTVFVETTGGNPAWSLDVLGSNLFIERGQSLDTSCLYGAVTLRGRPTSIKIEDSQVSKASGAACGAFIEGGVSSGVRLAAGYSVPSIRVHHCRIRSSRGILIHEGVNDLIVTDSVFHRASNGAVRDYMLGLGKETSGTNLTTNSRPFQNVYVADNVYLHEDFNDFTHPIFLGVGVSSAAGNAILERNVLLSKNNAQPGHNGSYGIVCKSDYVTFQDNVVYGDKAFYLSGVSRCEVVHNTIYGQAAHSIAVGGNQSKRWAHENEIYDNLFIGRQVPELGPGYEGRAVYNEDNAISFTGGNWVEATKRLVLPVNTLATYRHLQNLSKPVTITAGTGVAPGAYVIDGSLSSYTIDPTINPNYITLSTSLTGGNDVVDGSIEGTIGPSQNLGHVIHHNAYYMVDNPSDEAYMRFITNGVSSDCNTQAEGIAVFNAVGYLGNGLGDVYGDPGVVSLDDSNVFTENGSFGYTSSLDLRLTAASPLRGAASDGGDIGAFGFTEDPPTHPADMDGDSDVDPDDFDIFRACSTAPGVHYSIAMMPPACTASMNAYGVLSIDIDEDRDIDQTDFACFQLCLGVVELADAGPCCN